MHVTIIKTYFFVSKPQKQFIHVLLITTAKENTAAQYVATHDHGQDHQSPNHHHHQHYVQQMLLTINL